MVAYCRCGTQSWQHTVIVIHSHDGPQARRRTVMDADNLIATEDLVQSPGLPENEAPTTRTVLPANLLLVL